MNRCPWLFYKTCSALTQIVVLCPMSPSHYLNQYWLPMNDILFHKPQYKLTRNVQDINHYILFGNYCFSITSTSPKDQCVQQQPCFLKKAVKLNHSLTHSLAFKTVTNWARLSWPECHCKLLTVIYRNTHTMFTSICQNQTTQLTYI